MSTKVKTVVTKKTVPKKTATKVVAKKAVSKKPAKVKELIYADDSQSFWVKNGEILNNLMALRDALSSMEEAVFEHHVTKGKNDFADWVEDVLFDPACAVELRKAKSPAGAKIIVVRHLKTYKV